MFSELETPSVEELTWLQATVLFDNSLPLSAQDDINSQSDRVSLCSMSPSESSLLPSEAEPSQFRSGFPVTPPSEWIYRTPKSLSTGLITSASPIESRPVGGHYPSSLLRSRSNASSRTMHTLTEDCDDIKSSPTASFFSAILHPRTRPDASILPLRPLPSESQLTFTPPELTPTVTTPRTIPKPSHIKTPSLFSPLDSSLLPHSPASSRSDSPVTPLSLSSTCRTGRRRSYDVPRHRHRRCSHTAELHRTSISHSSPSKSILTRTASVSTKASSHTINKSVKFATIPTVHYATRAYWDVDIPDTNSMEINIDSMDLDDDPFANYRSREGSILEADENLFVTQPRESRSATPTPERSKQNPRRIKRLLRLARNPTGSRHGNKTTSERPVISSPYALGSYPANTYHVVGAESSSSSSSSSLISRPWMTSSLSLRRNNEAAGSTSSVALPIKNGLSCESLRRQKTSGSISLRSIESTSSRAERFRSWLSRLGWTPA